MTNPIVNELLHPWFNNLRISLNVVQDLSDDMIAEAPSPTAPPIGWHVFHIARFADRLQASLPNRLPEESHPWELPNQIWLVEDVAKDWGIDPDSLGWLETGGGMSIEQAIEVSSVDRVKLIGYAEKVFDAADNATRQLVDSDLTQPRNSIEPEFRVEVDGLFVTTGPRQTTVLWDMLFNISHSGRHLGMIEALKGAMFSVAGTASV